MKKYDIIGQEQYLQCGIADHQYRQVSCMTLPPSLQSFKAYLIASGRHQLPVKRLLWAGEHIKTSAAKMAAANLALQHATLPNARPPTTTGGEPHPIGNTIEVCLVDIDRHSIERLLAISSIPSYPSRRAARGGLFPLGPSPNHRIVHYTSLLSRQAALEHLAADRRAAELINEATAVASATLLIEQLDFVDY